MLFSHEKGHLPFATTCVDLEGVMLSEKSQTEKDKCCMVLFMRNLENSQTYRHRVGKGLPGLKGEANRKRLI